MQRLNSSSLFTIVFCAMVAFIGSCVSHDTDQFCPADDISYLNQVRPIVVARCAIPGCHNGDNGSDKNWLEFEKFQGKSLKVKEYVVGHVMPPSGQTQLTNEEISIISCWVDQGSQAN